MSIEEGTRGDLEFGSIAHLPFVVAERHGAAPAIIDGEVTLSFEDLASESRKVAKALIARGIGHGDRVGIWAPNMYEWIVVTLGVHAVGGCVVPINTRYKGGEAAYLLQKSEARALFTVNGFLGTNYVDLLKKSDLALPNLDDIVVIRGDAPEGAMTLEAYVAEGESVSDADASARLEAVTGEDTSDILFTSGTTGKPKGVICSHSQSLRTFHDWASIVGLRAGDHYLVVAPFFHSFGYKAGWLSALMMGATIFPEPVFDAGVVLERIGRDAITMLPGPPALYQTILARADLADFDLSSLRLAVTGAAAIPVELVHQMKNVLKFENVFTAYGLSEASGFVSICRAGDDAETIANTSGRAAPGVELRVVNGEGEECARGEAGEIVVRGYNVMSGYFGAEEQTKDAFDDDGWLQTGDVGVMDERGYIQITDRMKDMFIVGGFNAYPAEIENILSTHDAIGQVAVIGRPDPRLGEVGAAFVVLKEGASVTPEELITWSREAMANFKVPRTVEIMETLPTNATGKVLKFELRKRFD